MHPLGVCVDLFGAIAVVLGAGLGDDSLGGKSYSVGVKWVYIFNRWRGKKEIQV